MRFGTATSTAAAIKPPAAPVRLKTISAYPVWAAAAIATPVVGEPSAVGHAATPQTTAVSCAQVLMRARAATAGLLLTVKQPFVRCAPE